MVVVVVVVVVVAVVVVVFAVVVVVVVVSGSVVVISVVVVVTVVVSGVVVVVLVGVSVSAVVVLIVVSSTSSICLKDSAEPQAVIMLAIKIDVMITAVFSFFIPPNENFSLFHRQFSLFYPILFQISVKHLFKAFVHLRKLDFKVGYVLFVGVFSFFIQ